MRFKQVAEMLPVQQLDRVQMRVFLHLRVEELICDADFAKRHIGVLTPVERFAGHDLLECIPSSFVPSIPLVWAE